MFFTWGFIWGSCAEYRDTHTSPTATRSNIFKRAKGKKNTKKTKKKSLKNLNFSRNIQKKRKKKAPAGEKYIRREWAVGGGGGGFSFQKNGKRKKKDHHLLYTFRHWIEALLLHVCIDDGEVEGWCFYVWETLVSPHPHISPHRQNYPTHHHLVPFFFKFELNSSNQI